MQSFGRGRVKPGTSFSSNRLNWWYRTVRLQDTEDLVACFDVSHLPPVAYSIMHTGDNADLGNTVAVAEDDTDLGGSGALFGELADLVNDLVGGGLEPGRRAAGVGDGGGGNALALAVEATV